MIKRIRLINDLFDQLNYSETNLTDLIEGIRKKMAELAPSFGIGSIGYEYVLEKNRYLTRRYKNGNDLYISDEPIADLSQAMVFPYSNSNAGKTTIFIRPLESVKWSEDDKVIITDMANHIFSVIDRFSNSDIIRKISRMDSTTGLPNHSSFMEFCFEKSKEGVLGDYDVFFFNIRNFKFVNKALSYEEGNIILQSYAAKLHMAVSRSEMVGRIGGDNFTAIIKKENSDYFLNFLQNIHVDYTDKSGHVHEFDFSVIIGAIHLKEDMNPESIMVAVSYAHAEAKKAGHNINWYNERMMLENAERERVVTGFKEALRKGEFFVVYQPKVDLHDNKLCGAEALVRWKQGDEIISPGIFVPVLEQEGSICELDFFVLDQACGFIADCIKNGLEPVTISTNFSRRHLTNPNFVQDVLNIIDKHMIPHNCIDVELTESEDFNNYAIMENLVEGLQAAGVTTSIDDFGTGYSSLNMLKRTKLNLIKIDRSFIPLDYDYPDKEKDMIMFRHIVEIAHELGMNTIAEGVEKETQLKYLQDMDCHLVQGYVFDKPLDKNTFVQRLMSPEYMLGKDA